MKRIKFSEERERETRKNVGTKIEKKKKKRGKEDGGEDFMKKTFVDNEKKIKRKYTGRNINCKRR